MKIEHTAEIEVTEKQLSNLLCDAFEDGSNYWISTIQYFYKGKHMTADQIRKALKGKMPTCGDGSLTTKDLDDPAYLWLPFLKGGEVRIFVADEGDEFSGKVFILDKEHITLGLIKFSNFHKSHFANFISENDDAITGDVFLQCCLFGDVIFG